jgi:hypothetical protein
MLINCTQDTLRAQGGKIKRKGKKRKEGRSTLLEQQRRHRCFARAAQFFSLLVGFPGP